MNRVALPLALTVGTEAFYTQLDGARRPPPQLIYQPPARDALWNPEAVEVIRLSRTTFLAGATVNTAGLATSGSTPPHPAALGMGDGSSIAAMDFKALVRAVLQLRAMAVISDSEKKREGSQRPGQEEEKQEFEEEEEAEEEEEEAAIPFVEAPVPVVLEAGHPQTRADHPFASRCLRGRRMEKTRKCGLPLLEEEKEEEKGDLLSFANTPALSRFTSSRECAPDCPRDGQPDWLRQTSVAAWAQQHIQC